MRNHADSTYCGPQEAKLRLDERYDVRQHELINVRANFGMTHDHRRQADDDAQCTELLLWGRSTAQVQSLGRARFGHGKWEDILATSEYTLCKTQDGNESCLSSSGCHGQ